MKKNNRPTLEEIKEACEYVFNNTPKPKSSRALVLRGYCRGRGKSVDYTADPELCDDEGCFHCTNFKNAFEIEVKNWLDVAEKMGYNKDSI